MSLFLLNLDIPRFLPVQRNHGIPAVYQERPFFLILEHFHPATDIHADGCNAGQIPLSPLIWITRAWAPVCSLVKSVIVFFLLYLFPVSICGSPADTQAVTALYTF